jgi:N-acyl-D-amino-acid deacylase
MAFGLARTRGFELDEPGIRQQIDHGLAQLQPVVAQALANRDRIPDPPISLSYALNGMAAMQYPPDDTTAAMSQVIAAWQAADGAFHSLPPIRPPIEASDITATAMSLRAIQLYGSHQDEQVARAAKWLRAAEPRTTEDAAMQLLGLAWAKAKPHLIHKLTASLLALQRPDGGWAQMPALETDAYATGQALVALQASGYAVSSPEYQKAVGFLLRTQFPDGSWLVRTRSFPVQMPKDSGFPHGRHQWISAAGTSWATMALLLSLPPQPPAAARLLSRPLPADSADGLGRHAEIGGEHSLRDPGCD